MLPQGPGRTLGTLTGFVVNPSGSADSPILRPPAMNIVDAADGIQVEAHDRGDRMNVMPRIEV